GVATALGVLLALNVWMGLGVLLTWIVMAAVFRYSSLSALVAAVAAPVYAMMVHLRPELVLATAIMSMLLIWRHKSNIQNLMSGKENKIGSKKKAAPTA
ncbi:MAG: glycerol-3-phosphate acyltransferase, partial [Gallionellales bacterium CG_4_10_14_3_um_filter_54_96]